MQWHIYDRMLQVVHDHMITVFLPTDRAVTVDGCKIKWPPVKKVWNESDRT
jgi:hypothetical protein